MVVVHKQFIEFIKLAKRLPLFANKDPRATVKQGKQTNNKHFAHGQENLFFLFFHSHFSGWAARQTLGEIYDNEPTTVSGHNINNK